MRLLGTRTARLLSEVQEGNYNPYSKQDANEDSRLKQAIGKFYTKMLIMEKKKYLQPYLSESLTEMATVIGCLKQQIPDDALSASQESSEDEDGDRESLFSKFTASKRPSGFFGTQTTLKQHSTEVIVAPTTSEGKLFNEKHTTKRFQDNTMKSDQKGEGTSRSP